MALNSPKEVIKSAIESYMEIHETSEKTARDSIIELLSEETGKDPLDFYDMIELEREAKLVLERWTRKGK